MEDPSKAIGIFDSGLGGLTVMQELVRSLPQERFIYFGDTARLPYGEKSAETIIRYSIENAIFLLEKNVKMIVVACSTASSQALERLQQIFSVPLIGMIDPGAEHALRVTKNGRVAILGTKGTIQSQSYQKAFLKRSPHTSVFPIACPLFVPLVEEHYVDHPAAKLIVQEYLKPLKEHKVDTILLGCTHYPLLRNIIQEEMGKDVVIVDSAASCAEEVTLTLSKLNLKQMRPSNLAHQYFVSDNPAKFQALSKAFLNIPVNDVHLA